MQHPDRTRNVTCVDVLCRPCYVVYAMLNVFRRSIVFKTATDLMTFCDAIIMSSDDDTPIPNIRKHDPATDADNPPQTSSPDSSVKRAVPPSPSVPDPEHPHHNTSPIKVDSTTDAQHERPTTELFRGVTRRQLMLNCPLLQHQAVEDNGEGSVSQSQNSFDDRALSDLSYVTQGSYSDGDHELYMISISSQGHNYGFGTPMHQQRRGIFTYVRNFQLVLCRNLTPPMNNRSSYDPAIRNLAEPGWPGDVCPAGHKCNARLFERDGRHTCDKCNGAIAAGSTGARCNVCDYDLCCSCIKPLRAQIRAAAADLAPSSAFLPTLSMQVSEVPPPPSPISGIRHFWPPPSHLQGDEGRVFVRPAGRLMLRRPALPSTDAVQDVAMGTSPRNLFDAEVQTSTPPAVVLQTSPRQWADAEVQTSTPPAVVLQEIEHVVRAVIRAEVRELLVAMGF